MNNACENCKYWSEIITHSKFGRCRKNPPLLVLGIIDKEEEPKKADWAVWPRTYFSEWCGEWAAIKSKLKPITDEEKYTAIWNKLDLRAKKHLNRNGLKTLHDLTTKTITIYRDYGPATEKRIHQACQEVLGYVPPNHKTYHG